MSSSSSNKYQSPMSVEVPIKYGLFASTVLDAMLMSNLRDKGKTPMSIEGNLDGVANSIGCSRKHPMTTQPGVWKSKFLKLDDQGFIHIAESEHDEPKERQVSVLPPPPPAFQVTFLVKSVDEDNKGVTYTIGRDDPFFSVYEEYASQLGYEADEMLICATHDASVTGGKPICHLLEPLETPNDVGLEDGEVLIAESRNGLKNMDTSVKVFKMKAMSSPQTVKAWFKAKKEVQMKKVADIWAATRNQNPDQLLMVLNEQLLPRMGMVGASRIKNQDVVNTFVLT